jgi:hypothetical protein
VGVRRALRVRIELIRTQELGTMDADDRPNAIRREVIRQVNVRVRVPDAVPDESLFFLVALLAGAVCGYLAASF